MDSFGGIPLFSPMPAPSRPVGPMDNAAAAPRGEPPSRHSLTVTRPAEEVARRAGNSAFRRGAYGDAVRSYTAGIVAARAASSTTADAEAVGRLYGNRSAAWLALATQAAAAAAEAAAAADLLTDCVASSDDRSSREDGGEGDNGEGDAREWEEREGRRQVAALDGVKRGDNGRPSEEEDTSSSDDDDGGRGRRRRTRYRRRRRTSPWRRLKGLSPARRAGANSGGVADGERDKKYGSSAAELLALSRVSTVSSGITGGGEGTGNPVGGGGGSTPLGGLSSGCTGARRHGRCVHRPCGAACPGLTAAYTRRAVRDARRATAAAPHDATAWHRLADALVVAGSPVAARDALGQGLGHCPGEPQLIAALQRVEGLISTRGRGEMDAGEGGDRAVHAAAQAGTMPAHVPSHLVGTPPVDHSPLPAEALTLNPPNACPAADNAAVAVYAARIAAATKGRGAPLDGWAHLGRAYALLRQAAAAADAAKAARIEADIASGCAGLATAARAPRRWRRGGSGGVDQARRSLSRSTVLLRLAGADVTAGAVTASTVQDGRLGHAATAAGQAWREVAARHRAATAVVSAPPSTSLPPLDVPQEEGTAEDKPPEAAASPSAPVLSGGNAQEMTSPLPEVNPDYQARSFGGALTASVPSPRTRPSSAAPLPTGRSSPPVSLPLPLADEVAVAASTRLPSSPLSVDAAPTVPHLAVGTDMTTPPLAGLLVGPMADWEGGTGYGNRWALPAADTDGGASKAEQKEAVRLSPPPTRQPRSWSVLSGGPASCRSRALYRSASTPSAAPSSTVAESRDPLHNAARSVEVHVVEVGTQLDRSVSSSSYSSTASAPASDSPMPPLPPRPHALETADVGLPPTIVVVDAEREQHPQPSVETGPSLSKGTPMSQFAVQRASSHMGSCSDEPMSIPGLMPARGHLLDMLRTGGKYAGASPSEVADTEGWNQQPSSPSVAQPTPPTQMPAPVAPLVQPLHHPSTTRRAVLLDMMAAAQRNGGGDEVSSSRSRAEGTATRPAVQVVDLPALASETEQPTAPRSWGGWGDPRLDEPSQPQLQPSATPRRTRPAEPRRGMGARARSLANLLNREASSSAAGTSRPRRSRSPWAGRTRGARKGPSSSPNGDGDGSDTDPPSVSARKNTRVRGDGGGGGEGASAPSPPPHTPSPAEQDLYEILGVSAAAATPTRLKKAYHARARAVHPDRHPDDENATQNFQQLTAAYHILLAVHDDGAADGGRQNCDDDGATANAEVLDPATLFTRAFGGQRFAHLLGRLQVMNTASGADGMMPGSQPLSSSTAQSSMPRTASLSRRAVQAARVAGLTTALAGLVAPYVAGDKVDFTEWAAAEATRLLASEADGPGPGAFAVPILHAIGKMYVGAGQRTLNAMMQGVSAPGASAGATAGEGGSADGSTGGSDSGPPPLVLGKRLAWTGLHSTRRLAAAAAVSAYAAYTRVRHRWATVGGVAVSSGGSVDGGGLSPSEARRAVTTLWRLCQADIASTLAAVTRRLLSASRVAADVAAAEATAAAAAAAASTTSPSGGGRAAAAAATAAAAASWAGAAAVAGRADLPDGTRAVTPDAVRRERARALVVLGKAFVIAAERAAAAGAGGGGAGGGGD